MMRKFFKSIPTLLLASLIVASPVSAQGKSHLVWKSSIGQSTVYLMGSIHFGLPSMYPLPERIMSAFESSDALLVEVDIASVDQNETIALVSNAGMYQDGTTLQDHLPSAQFQRLERAITQLGLPVQLMLPQKPWLAVLTLSAISVELQGFSEQLGVDRYFLDRVSKQQVIEIESLEQQLALLSGFSDKEQQWMLTQTLAELDDGGVALREMVLNWQSGDEPAFNQLTIEEFPEGKESDRIFKAMFTDRNRTMAEFVAKLAGTKPGTYFVVVGAGHLIGSDGVPALLKKRGYSIDRY
ncbi:MAG: TraB/GumN family protein [Pseudomonadales bacterium]|nr:TraB/GumN family protein [Pseudomonadales bacterium]